MNTTESFLRFVTAAIVSVLLVVPSGAPVRAQDTADQRTTPESPLRTTVETGLSVSAWQAASRIQSVDSPPFEGETSCPAAMGTNTRLGIAYRVARRAEVGGFVTYDMSQVRGCRGWGRIEHELHTVTLGPTVTLRPLLAPQWFFRLGVGATWLRGHQLLRNWEPRGVGASAELGFEVLHGRRATVFVSGGFSASLGFRTMTSNNPDYPPQEWSLEVRSLAGTLRIGAYLH